MLSIQSLNPLQVKVDYCFLLGNSPIQSEFQCKANGKSFQITFNASNQ